MKLALEEKVVGFCQEKNILSAKDKVVVGVSGGPDSICLLHLLKNLPAKYNLCLTVAHLNHQLRDEAQADEDFVRAVTSDWGLPFFVETCSIARLAAERGQSIEETGRYIRYKFLLDISKRVNATKIAVGHNADDQVETVLMHFLRGTGLAGLRGMLPITDMEAFLKDGSVSKKLIRPLLEISRTEIDAYCKIHNLNPRQDASNQDTTFFRNRLRYELIPELETFNPKIRQSLQHMAKVAVADFEVLNDQVEKVWYEVAQRITDECVEFVLDSWLCLPLALKRATLRRAIYTLRRSLRDVSFEHIENAITIIEKGRTGQKASFPQGLMLVISYDKLIVTGKVTARISPKQDVPYIKPYRIVPLNLPGLTKLPQTNWQLKADLVSKHNVGQSYLYSDSWQIYVDADVVGKSSILRSRRPGDVFHPFGMVGHSQKVSEFMINQKIPVEQRDYVPLLVTDGRILWVCGYRCDEYARLQSSTERIMRLKFEQF